MRLLDLNLLLYAADETSPQHVPARRWVEDELSSTRTVGMAWTVIIGFVRLSTRAAVFTRPLRVSAALDVVDGWLAQPNVTVLHPGDRHASLLRELLEPLGAAGNLTTDAHLAALAIEHGAQLCTTDADFARFRGLSWTNPLAPDGARG